MSRHITVMPGLVQRGSKRHSNALSDDEDEILSSSTPSSKRARDATDSSISADHRGHLSRRQGDAANSTDLIAGDVFQPGSLIRVKLQNFVTYKAAEFHLGPSLNMIIGPNGTGKSTLVCAICLGLGWGSEHLGRAKELGQFVKHGAAEASIEIELAASADMESNPIVRRAIRKEDNKSFFLLNGKRVAQSVVVAMAKGFSIQIDNLCQFLPQDRVVEFARMTDVDRLRETQRAAAPPHMIEWHDQLKALRLEEKTLRAAEQNEKDRLERLEKQQNAARADVERWRERKSLLQRSRCLGKVKPVIEIHQHKDELGRIKLELQMGKQELDRINLDVEPVQRAQMEVEGYCKQVEEVVKFRKHRVETTVTQAAVTFSKLEKDKLCVLDLQGEIKGEVHSKKERDRDVARVRAEIAKLEHEQQNPPVRHDTNIFDQRRAELRNQFSAISNRLVEVEDAYQGLRSKGHDFNRRNKEAMIERAQLDTQDGKQASILQKTSRDTAKAWEWFQENKDSLPLQGQVYGPPILVCSIPNLRYAQAVESQLRKGDVVAITCTNNADWRLLSDKFLSHESNGGLGLHDIYLRSSSQPYSSYQPPVSADQMESFGFEGYIIDYISGPEEVLAMLCDNARLHRIAFASKSITDTQHDLVSKSPIQTWVSGNEIYKISTRKEYSQSSIAVTQLKSPSFFIDQPVDVEEKRRLDEKIEDIRQGVTELQEQIKTAKEELTDLQRQRDDVKRLKDDMQTEHSRMQKAAAEWAALPGKIAQKQTVLDDCVEMNAQTSARIQAIKRRSRNVSLNIAALTLEYAKTVTQTRIFYESLTEAEIWLIEAKSECAALKNENSEILLKQQRMGAEIEKLTHRNRTLRLKHDQLVEMTQNEIENLTGDEKQIVREYSKLPSLEALDNEIQAVNARLEIMVEGNPGAIVAYEKREEEIQKIQEKLQEHSESLEVAQQQVADIRRRWEPQLDELMSKINDAFAYNFQQIDCAGEVMVYKDEEDFDNWSIQISVRFREGETLSVLNSHRQSGGERAISTIFYLMALQDLAQSPFRVVDEINQGMDPRNERMVHERMVDIACQERTSQYFLVTPKLLSGLEFHPKMKVHIINSGEHVSDMKSIREGWDLKNVAKIALKNKQRRDMA